MAPSSLLAPSHLTPPYLALYLLFANAPARKREAPFSWGPLSVRALWGNRTLPSGVVRSAPSGTSAPDAWASPLCARATLASLLHNRIIEPHTFDARQRPTSYRWVDGYRP